MSRVQTQTPTPARTLRCAIYTRKSSEEGLDQAFNSLHAQREACEAYVASQKGEGWVALKAAYDDGGISGGTMERAGLQQLLTDVDAGRVDVVVVYKVDRLTRSLADFAKIVERFDAKGVSFVSVTQAFNTTTSMGRLTLNILLSFAQFEREVTGERIRDKISASKKKGMWMGGRAPLGYDPPTDAAERALVINPGEAEQVCGLFHRYLELGSVHALKLELDASGATSKRWTTSDGRAMGGQRFSRGALFHLLKNRTYLGEITHRDQSYPGRHPALLSPELFDQVQAQLKANAAVRQVRSSRVTVTAPLTGLIVDAQGRRMSPSFGYGKDGRRYRYYVCAELQRSERKPKTGEVGRVPGPPLEALVLDRLQRLAERVELTWAEGRAWVRGVQLNSASVEVLLDPAALGHTPASLLARRLPPGDRLEEQAASLRLILPIRPVFRGGRTWLVTPDGAAGLAKARVDPALTKALWQARRELVRLNAGPLTPPEQMIQAEGVPDSYLRRLAPLAFLAPDIQRALLEGRQPAGLTLQQIIDQDLPLAWADQRRKLGFVAAA